MAKFAMELPTDVLRELERVYGDTDNIFGAMTAAAAEVVLQNVQTNAPEAIRKSNMMRCLWMTRPYKTPSDGGINTKVGFFGYFINRNGVRTPAPLVANVFEYGSSKAQKRPFFRKAFRREQIRKAMLEAQKKASGGILDE